MDDNNPEHDPTAPMRPGEGWASDRDCYSKCAGCQVPRLVALRSSLLGAASELVRSRRSAPPVTGRPIESRWPL